MSIHDGHRQRLKNRFRKDGLDNFDELYVLELLLFYGSPRKDTNPLAHALLDHFGSLSKVLDAPIEELELFPGVTPHLATLLKLIPQVSGYYRKNQTKIGKIFNSIEMCGSYLVSCFSGKEQENVYLLCLDAKCEFICCKKVGEGSVNSANVPIRKVVEIALNANATTVVLAHNHPSGLAIPSADDVQTTFKVAAALESVDVVLADHLVVANGDYVSICQSNYYKPNEKCPVF